MKMLIKNFLELERKDRVVFFLLCSTILNYIVAIVKLVLSFVIPSLWFLVNSIFLFTIGICRFLSIKEYRKIRLTKNKEKKLILGYKNYSANGVMLILIGIAYFGVSTYMYYKGTNTNMHEYITYLVALVAFTSIGSAIYGMIKYKKNQDPIIKGIKITNFAKALTSIVLTQVVLLDTFNEGWYDSRLNGYTGMGVSLIIIVLGLYMILGSKKEN